MKSTRQKDPTMTTEDSELIRKEACPHCGSSDANALYTDGHHFCFSCNTHTPGENTMTQTTNVAKPTHFVSGEPKALAKRGLTLETCRKWGYEVGTYQGQPVQVANYKDDKGKVVAQKLRFPGKDFKFFGDSKEAGLYGQHLWRDGGKMVTITEGEIDAMSLSQAFQNRYSVVSLRSGAAGAKRDVLNSIEWLESYDTVILMFDQDEVGQKATAEVASLFSPGKVKVAKLPLKDANEMLVNGKVKELVDSVWEAKTYRPDGLVSIDDLLEELDKPIEKGLPWFLPSLTDMTYGRRECELYAFGAGTGIGKTDFLTQQIAYDVTELDQKVGLFFLEQKPTETAKRVAGKIEGKRFHVPDGSWEMDQLKRGVQHLKGKVTFYDSFGQTDWGVIDKQIRYLAHAEGIKLFYIDHLTAMADTSDEKGSLEQIMKEMAGLANELKVIIHFVSHLTTPDGKPHEEGGHVSIRHFKGSRAIGFWSYYMFGLERNQQDPDTKMRQITTFRVLKDRYTGQATGNLLYLGYDKESGRLYETELEAEDVFEDEEF